MEGYKPGQRIQKVTAFQDANWNDHLTALQLRLWSLDDSYLDLSTIGNDDYDESNAKEWEFWGDDEQPDRISILTSEDQGICNVILYQGHTTKINLSEDTQECQVELKGVEETMIRLTPEVPLVGFHGMATEDSLDSLGLILVDTLNPRCQLIKPSLNKELEFLKPYSEVAQDLAVENSITPDE